MNRRRRLIGAAAAGVVVPAGIGGVALWARRDIDGWRDAVAAIRRPLAPAPPPQYPERGRKTLRFPQGCWLYELGSCVVFSRRTQRTLHGRVRIRSDDPRRT